MTSQRIFDEKMECQDRAALTQLQLERLEATLNRVARAVPFYKQRFQELGVDPDGLASLDDVARLPFTTKADIREHYPYGLFAVPLRDVVRLQASSGTTGKPTVVGYTRNDMHRWADLAARVLTAGGVTEDDVVQIAFGYGLFTGGFGLHQGAQRIGASVIPASGGNSKRQVMILEDYRTTALCCTPGYALHLAEVMRELGVERNRLHLRWGLFGAESWSEATRTSIEERLGLTATDNYGVSEVMGPGVAGECLQQAGLHVNEDHFLLEIVHPETGEPLPDGELGELVLTSLTKEAFPVIRFRTGDLTRKITQPCPCGRTFHRIEKIRGRADDMLIVRGVNVFPSQVEAVLARVEGVAPHFRIRLTRENYVDVAELIVEASETHHYDTVGLQQRFVKEIERAVASELGVHFTVKLVNKNTLERTPDKAHRVVDERSL